MAPSIKHLVLHGDYLFAPNVLKVMLVLKELNLPFHAKRVPFDSIKKPAYIALNPNGRLPTLHDPNRDITIWESGAIIQYLVSQYDKAHKLSFAPHTKEHHFTNQWLHFQMSGQGPYYGQGYWFAKAHPEYVPSAIERYQKEARRVTGVLNLALQGKEYLVGNKLTYADLAFIPWQCGLIMFDPEFDVGKEAPNVAAWMERMEARPVVAELLGRLREEDRRFRK